MSNTPDDTAVVSNQSAVEDAELYADVKTRHEALKLQLDVLEVELKRLKARLLAAVPEAVDTLVMTTRSGTKLRITPTTTAAYSPAAGNSEMFWQWAKINNRFDLVQRRVSSTGIVEYAEQHGAYPPFIEKHDIRDVRITLTKAPA